MLLPTRDRPHNLTRMLESIADTADELRNIEIVVYIDDDDTTYDDCPALDGVRLVRGPRVVLSEMWNECYKVATGDILMHCGDDVIFRTPSWDTIVEATFAEYSDHIVFVFGRDGSPHDNETPPFGTHGFIHRRWAETVGYFVPPYFSSDYNDTWLNDVANKIGRLRPIDIFVEHMHFSLGKGDLDKTHRDRLERHERDNPEEIWAGKEPERQLDAAKLRVVMDRAVAAAPLPAPGPGETTASLEYQLEIERKGRESAEAELAAIRQTRSYRWTLPARQFRSSPIGHVTVRHIADWRQRVRNALKALAPSDTGRGS